MKNTWQCFTHRLEGRIKRKFLISIITLIAVAMTFACGGEHRLYKGKLNSDLTDTTYGHRVSKSDDAEVTMSVNGDNASVTFRIADKDSLSNILGCTLQLEKTANMWKQKSRQECHDGAYFISDGRADVGEGGKIEISLNGATSSGSFKSKYSFIGQESAAK